MKNLLYSLFVLCGFAFVANAQVKVGANPTTINANSLLEMESTNKGLLFPRVALTSTTSFAPLSAHVQGMTVYNTATVGDVTPGIYINNGTAWKTVGGVPAGVPTLQFVVQDITTYSGGNAYRVTPTLAIVDNNLSNGWNTGTSVFVVPATGYYNLSASTTAKANNGGISAGGYSIVLERSTNNGVTWTSILNLSQNLNDCCDYSQSTTHFGKFNANDQLRLAVQFCGGCSATSYSLKAALFSATRVQ